MAFDILGSSGGVGYDILGPSAIGAEPKDIQGTPTPMGWLKNLAGDIGELAQGITGIVGAVGHDILAGVEHLIPGEQQAEEEGFRTLAIAKALPGAIAGDYARRYGGATNIARGLYEDPLSYLLDVIAVAGGVGAAAKVGRAGVLAKAPAILPDETAARILGATAETGWVPQRALGNVAGKASQPSMFTLSQNPANRWMQNQTLDLLSVTPQSETITRAVSLMDDAAEKRASEVIQYAKMNGIRIVRPGPIGNYVRNRDINRLMSTARVNTRDLTQDVRDTVTTIVDEADLEDVDKVGLYMRGATPDVPINTSPIPVAGIDEGIPTASTPFMHPRDLDTLKERFGVENVHLTNIETPHSPYRRDQIPYDIRIVVPTVDDIPKVGEEALALIGAQRNFRKNYYVDDDIYDGYHVGGVKDDGTIVDISVTTPGTYDAQRAYSFIKERTNGVNAEIARLQAEFIETLDENSPEALQIADEIRDQGEELYALNELGRAQFFGNRMSYWDPDIDPHLRVAEQLRPTMFRETSERWLKYSPTSSARAYWNRAYADQRIATFKGMLARMRTEFQEVLASTADTREAIPLLTNILAQDGIPPQLIEKILGARPWKRNPKQGADALTRKARANLYDYMVKEGGDGGVDFGFPEYDWRVMHAQRVEGGLNIPQYFPHYAAKPSEGLGLVAASQGSKSLPSTSKAWKGKLAEEGQVLNDPAQVASRAAAEWIAHEEVSALFDDAVELVGRPLTKKQAMVLAAKKDSSEVVVSPEQFRQQLSLRAEALMGTLDNMGDGLDYESALMREITDLTEKAWKESVDSIAVGKVYAMPRSVMKKFQDEARYRLGSDTLRTYWDGPMSLWRAAVLSLSPRWVVNNVFGNGVFMGLENPGAFRYMLGQHNKRVSSVTKEILGEFEARESRGFFRENASYGSVIPEDATGPVLRMARWLRDSRVGRGLHVGSEWVRNKNTHYEQAARRSVLLNELSKKRVDTWMGEADKTYKLLEDALRKGDLTEAVMDPVIKGVNRTLGDYTHYTPAEQYIIKRFFIPFYGFYRHSAKVILRLPFAHPYKAQALRQIEAIDEEFYSEFPEWFRGSINVAELGGEQLYLRLQNLNPLHGVTEYAPFLGMVNPVAKLAIERQLGVDTFTGEPFRTPDNVFQTWDGNYYQAVEDGAGNVVGVELLPGPPRPDLVRHLASQFPQLSLFPSFQRYPKSVALQFASMLGAPLSQSDIQGTSQRMAEAEQEALTALQNRASGGTGTFDILGGA